MFSNFTGLFKTYRRYKKLTHLNFLRFFLFFFEIHDENIYFTSSCRTDSEDDGRQIKSRKLEEEKKRFSFLVNALSVYFISAFHVIKKSKIFITECLKRFVARYDTADAAIPLGRYVFK